MPEPTVTRQPTPPGSVIVVRVHDTVTVETVEELGTELHRQTGLPVVITSGDADLSVSTRDEAVAALRRANATVRGYAGDFAAMLDELAADGWELVRVRQP